MAVIVLVGADTVKLGGGYIKIVGGVGEEAEVEEFVT